MPQRVKIDMAAFRRDVEEGTSVLALSEKFGVSKATIWKLKAQLSGKLARREEMPTPVDCEAPEAFDITLNVPTERLDDLLTAAEADELRTACLELGVQAKAELFQAVLQGRLDRALSPQAVEIPTFHALE